MDTWEYRREAAKKSKHERNYYDVEYRKLSGTARYLLLDVYCSKSGHWLGRYEVSYPYFKDDVLTETAHHYMESVLVKSGVISRRNCDLDILLSAGISNG